MDAHSSEQDGRVAFGLFERLGFFTDDPERWAEFPNVLIVYRGGDGAGMSWTVNREVVDYLVKGHGLSPIWTGIVGKDDVLAYFAREEEVVVFPGCVGVLDVEHVA